MPQTTSDPKITVQPVILASGSGTRLWPLSRKHYAKQYLSLDGTKTMLQSTVARIEALSFASPYIICNEETRFLAAEQMRQIGQEQASILLEPAGRNTASAIALAALQAISKDEDPVMLVMPADHKISDTSAFAKAVQAALPLACSNQLVTFGIIPSDLSTASLSAAYGIHLTSDVQVNLGVSASMRVDDGVRSDNQSVFITLGRSFTRRP